MTNAELDAVVAIVREVRARYPEDVFPPPRAEHVFEDQCRPPCYTLVQQSPDRFSASGARLACDEIERLLREKLGVPRVH